MSKEKKPEDDPQSDSGFDLSAPTLKIEKTNPAGSGVEESTKSGNLGTPINPRLSSEPRSLSDWKGFEDEEEYAPEVLFKGKGVFVEEMDMTPMVDVTFLLLIFFMVSASFTVQKSIQQPPLSTEDPSTNTTIIVQEESQYVEVIIDQFNTYRLTSKDSEETEAPSDQEMRTRMRDMINSTMAKRVIITAHGEAFHEKVVTAWDAATDNDIADVIIRMSEEDF